MGTFTQFRGVILFPCVIRHKSIMVVCNAIQGMICLSYSTSYLCVILQNVNNKRMRISTGPKKKMREFGSRAALNKSGSSRFMLSQLDLDATFR